MSKEKNQSGEAQKEVVISADDCRAALDFWSHFEIPMTSELQKAMDDFAQNPSLENQDQVKLEVCRAISGTDHPAFKDEMFQKIVEECSNVLYDMQFDRDLEATLTTEEK
jgi:hypothetical protein